MPLSEASLLPVQPETGQPTAQAVADFLLSHPEFLAERPELYRVLEPPKRVHGERLADHMAAMLFAERRRVRSLEAEVDAAVTAGRAGHGLTIRVRLAVLALMRSTDVVDTVTQELPALLGIETCTLMSEKPDRRGILPLTRGTVSRLLPPGRDAVVRATPAGEAELLHQEAAALVCRDALVRVPIWTGYPTLLTLGARDAAALPARQAIATLAFLGRAVAAALAR
ncbi:DUF484 family protein [Siccirubricoccus sp. KC 17139]|uniref:DUF484 family protein n=1 Tax=Siccirubricoccus soli TaxID=2899147 RepID=A0ABT1D3H2_9PROT|nr:DUF484 family protein [Siccirubricoccus soli]MCO6416473.1 DUF484 family protein [Siccirubricoccus soli]MCP2682607.1 DUF484 family protein [Siccirubricoccus soli]